MIDYRNRQRAQHLQQTAYDHDPSRHYSQGPGVGGVNFGGFAQAEAARQQSKFANMAALSSNQAYLNEQNADYERRMAFDEREQANRHNQEMAKANAGANEAAIKAGALGGMLGGLNGGVGSINVQAPSTNLYDNNGNRIGGSYFSSALLR